LAGEAGLVASGVFCTTSGELAVANSNGLWAYDRSTKVNAMTVITGEQGAGYAERTSHSVGEIDLEALALEAVDKARRGRSPIELEPGEYPVLLEGYAVGEALSYLSYIGFGALALQEERSFMAGRLGTRIMSEQIAIWDDGLDRRGLPCAFDFEGVGKQKVALVEDGFARGVVYDTRTGARDTRPSTGHALPAPNTFGPFAWNLFMAPGRHTTEAMAREIDRGVWVTRFHYVNVVHAREAILTGMTRDGTFLIERGEVGPPIKNLRFTQNMLEALSSVRAVGSDNRAVEGFIGVNMVPALLLDRFNFTGSSTAWA